MRLNEMGRLNVVGIAFLSASAVQTGAAHAGIVIDDKSDFDGGAFTVIDFESLGDGSPLLLGEGRWIELEPDEFATRGVRISAHMNFMGRERAFIANGIPSERFDLAHELVASSPNVLFAPNRGDNGHLRFDFVAVINAFGVAVISNSIGRGERMEAFNSMDQLLGVLDFEKELVDGTLLGSKYGFEGNLSFGFFGMYFPDASIDHVIITKGASSFDDLYFGVIPEPSTLLLLFGGGLVAMRRRRAGATGSLPARADRRRGLAFLIRGSARAEARGSLHIK